MTKSHPLGGALCAAAIAMNGIALAQSDETERRAQAQTLFDDAQKLIAQRNFAAGCAKLEEVVKLQPGKIGALMELGECYEGWGKTASAWARYRMASDLAAKTGDARKADADTKIALLEPQVSRLLVLVPESMRWLGGLVIARDGVPLGPAGWGAAMPADPGAHEVSASAPGKKRWSTKVELTRPGMTITVTVAALEDAPKAVSASEMPSVRTAGYVVGALGLVGIGIGSVFGAQAASKRDEANNHCDMDSCTDVGHALEQQAFGNAAVSSVSVIAGAALLAGGVTMVLWPSPKSAAATTGPAARIVVKPGGMFLQGVW